MVLHATVDSIRRRNQRGQRDFGRFRGFDTFGEITVLGIAGIGALCLMDGMRTTARP